MEASRGFQTALVGGMLAFGLGLVGCSEDSGDAWTGAEAGAGTGAGTTSGGGGSGAGGTSSGSGGSTSGPDICDDIGDTFGMGAAIFGDTGTQWVESATQTPHDIDWTYGYMYASGDPHDNLEGFAWIVNYRLDTAEQVGAEIPTVTYYRMLNVGEEHGYTSGTEAQIVQQMLQDSTAVHDYIEDFVVLLGILNERDTPSLVHVEPDSWGFMMWAFDGVDSVNGNSDATAVPVSLSGANHSALQGQSFPDHAGGLGQALLYLRDQIAPEARMGWHASNFRVGTRPEVVTTFYSSMGPWDLIVTEPPHMVHQGSSSWDTGETDNANNFDWLSTVSSTTGLPIVIWQTYVSEAESYVGAWPANTTNLTALADRGVAGVLWDPNGVGAGCGYSCAEADGLLDGLSDYTAAPLSLPAGHPCAPSGG